nr:50S ribosomal protein L11 methyltransferase [Anaerolineae bacterium]
MTDWIEVSLSVDGEGAEIAADILRRYVHKGIVIESRFPGEAWEDETLQEGPLTVRGYFPVDSEKNRVRRQIEEAIYYASRLYPLPEPAFTSIKEDDWANAWKRHYYPVRVGDHIVIKPAWIDVHTGPDDVVIAMDPGMAFGTGTHPTTQLCLQAVEWFAKPGTCMVDIGTGSGILAIAAAKLGCYRVLALDIDEIAVRVAQENVERNGVSSKVIAMQGSLNSLTSTSRHFDWAVANLTANIIKDLIPQSLQYIIWPGGKFIFSGILAEQVSELIPLLESIDLELIGQRQAGDWVMLITRRRVD